MSIDKDYYYKALLRRDSSLLGIFYVGVKTTGVFCDPTCGARKPKLENCEFFETAQEALLAGYRPCKRCKPLQHPNQESPTIKTLIEQIENNPYKRWKNQDFVNLGIDSSTARRQFKKRFGMTFIEYARARRMGVAMKQIREGQSIIDAQLDLGYNSSSGFRDAFSKIMGNAPSKTKSHQILKAHWIDTPLGAMIIIANDELLYLLEFVDRRGLEREIERLRLRLNCAIIPGLTKITKQITQELEQYFLGKLNSFKTKLFYLGSDFQKNVWHELQRIPYGKTISYLELAQKIGKPTAFRAVANANGANQLAIIIPCHRVINSSGELGGYGGGISRKEWMIKHEYTHAKNNRSNKIDASLAKIKNGDFEEVTFAEFKKQVKQLKKS